MDVGRANANTLFVNEVRLCFVCTTTGNGIHAFFPHPYAMHSAHSMLYLHLLISEGERCEPHGKHRAHTHTFLLSESKKKKKHSTTKIFISPCLTIPIFHPEQCNQCQSIKCHRSCDPIQQFQLDF